MLMRSPEFSQCASTTMSYLFGGALWLVLASASRPDGRGLCLTSRSRPPGERANVKLHVDNWTTSRLAASVAQILIEERLGHVVELTAATGTARDVYEHLARGVAHVATEVWPDGKAAALAAHGTCEAMR